jgi:hypothetical protein
VRTDKQIDKQTNKQTDNESETYTPPLKAVCKTNCPITRPCVTPAHGRTGCFKELSLSKDGKGGRNRGDKILYSGWRELKKELDRDYL